MKNINKRIGVDVGGSHVSASVVETDVAGRPLLNVIRKEIDSFASANEIIDAIANCINEVLPAENRVDAIGLSFPGPFNYKKGISELTGVGGKFQSMFGLHVEQALKSATGLNDLPFVFTNDAHCFAIGAYHRYELKSKRTIFLTLGTGFGSAFMDNGKLLETSGSIPLSGAFYDQPFLEGKAEDYISTRWFLNEYAQQTGKNITSVKELAQSNSELSQSVFKQFGSNLGAFLQPWLEKFECDELVIGGNIAKSSKLFAQPLLDQLQSKNSNVNVVFCDDTDDCILTGAVIVSQGKQHNKVSDEGTRKKRKSIQPLLPLSATVNSVNAYNIYPAYQASYPVYKGFDSLADMISKEKIVIIDGYVGVLWELFREHLQKELQVKNKKVFWFDITSAMHDASKIEAMLLDSLNGNDPVFGKRYTGSLDDFFDSEKLKLLQPDQSADINIVYGTGAALSKWDGFCLYVDVPKNEIQYRMRAGSITNLGALTLSANSQMYKRFYFVDWPVLNQHKQKLLEKIDCIVDEQRITDVTWMYGDEFRNTLQDMYEHALRVRPWFESGVWGGNWMKKNMKGLNQEEVNYAWSFELITPENGIVLEGDNYLLEVSFDFLLFCNNTKLLGKAANRFGYEFPIRFDFLDTYNGGNLSVQCHPRTSYIREKFGESFTQDETYYILDCENNASVYLGFQEDVDPSEFKTALQQAQNNAVEVDIEKFVQKHKANKHDLFLIPNGTVHASGKNNLVLEISNTPYIFTFKMYDWLRLDLNGLPRPINIEHAFNNLYFDRQGQYVTQFLISHPYVEKEWVGGRKLKLPTHQEHFYTIDRYEFTGEISIHTNGQCHCCMLVEGASVEITTGNKSHIFNYAETFIIPAHIEKYEVRYAGKTSAYLVVAYMKDDCC